MRMFWDYFLGHTVNTFKHRLDKFWLNQEVNYNYKADLAGLILVSKNLLYD